MKVLGAPPPTSEQLRIISDTRTGIEIIRGAAGSGKTTVGRTVLRLEEPTDGEIRFAGTDITHLALYDDDAYSAAGFKASDVFAGPVRYIVGDW